MIGRRTVLAGAAGLSATGFWLGTDAALAAPRDAVMVPAASPLGLPDDLKNPPEVHSTNGVLRTALSMTVNRVTLPGGPADLRLFNGMLPGPTLRLSAGDTLEIAFANRMPRNPDTKPTVANIPDRFNTTNVHYHGFHVSPRGNSDNVYLQIEPGQRFNYVLKIPKDHPAGNYWYHPHRHGSVAAQVASGAAGMAVIRGALDDVPEIRQAVERILVVQAPIPGVDGLLKTEDPIWPLDAERNFLINGQFRPRIYLREGEVQHWRVLHAGDAQFLPLRLDGLELHEIGRDGNPLPAAEQVAQFEIAPGNRANLLVKALKPGVYPLRRPAFMQGKAALPEIHLADVVVVAAGDPRIGRQLPFGRDIPKGPLPRNAMLRPVADGEISVRRQLVLGVSEVKGYFRDTEFTINGRPFDPGRDDVRARLGAAEEWTFVNKTPFPHPIHIHVNPFEVISANGVPDPRRPWLDTCAVPAAGTLVMRTRFTDFTGRYVLHCHILPHEDTGMMININVES